jgi:hypothetical protein
VRRLTFNGMDLPIWDDLSVGISGTSVVRVALVSDSVKELLGDEGPVVMTFAGMTCPAPIVSSRLTGAKTSTGRRPAVPVNNEIANADLPTQFGADLPNLWSEHPWRGVGPRRRSASVAVPRRRGLQAHVLDKRALVQHAVSKHGDPARTGCMCRASPWTTKALMRRPRARRATTGATTG